MSWSTQSWATRIELTRRAGQSLDVQYYQVHDDETGRAFLRALRDAALRGVRVRLLIDDLYTAGADPLLLGLAAHANIELRLFNPFPAAREKLSHRLLASLFDLGRVNHRMHNKLFIADGAMAIAGGRNIGNEYFMVHDGANYIDLDAFAVGAVVPALATLFDGYWNSGHVYPLHSIVASTAPDDVLRRQFDDLTAPQPGGIGPAVSLGDRDALGLRALPDEMRSGRLDLIWARAEAFADTPEKVIGHARQRLAGEPPDPATVRQTLMSALSLARQQVLLTSPYLVPDRFVMDEIREARLWGLSITLITNSLASTDEPLVHAGYQRFRTELLDLGVELYEVAPGPIAHSRLLGPFGRSIGRFHAKTAAIDGQVLFIGSLNFDPRSDKHNTELGLIIHSAPLTAQLLQLAELVKSQAAYRVRLDRQQQRLSWEFNAADGAQTLDEEPDTGFWQRLLLRLVGPFVPDEYL
jgi:phosphatidylserine/phosphatidylglycerophosphate/cardiolipin synthase-like enzyme